MRPLIIDSFAGGGGASTGIEMALGRSPDIAINHNAAALALHAANHPQTLHLSENIYKIDPLDHVAGKHIGLAWFSPDCKHFSKAKGAAPVERNIRDLATIIPHWVRRVRQGRGKIDVIIMENVEEFRDWGPLIEVERKGKLVLMPDPARKGDTFTAWCKELKRLGGKLEYRELRASNYGARTIRKRLFVIVRFDGMPIVWPIATHGKPGDPDVMEGRKDPWLWVAPVIDWTLPCPSIFDTSAEIYAKYGLRAVRPLAEATMSRVARGTDRYAVKAKRPFIVVCNHQGAHFRGQGLDEPISTLTATRDAIGLISPSVIRFNTGATGQDAREPLSTITANSFIKRPGGAAPLGVIAPVLSAYYGKGTGSVDRSARVDEPVKTIVTENRHAVIAPVLTYAQQGGGNRSVEDPAHTITASSKDQNAVIVPTLVGCGGRAGQSRPRGGGEPMATVTAKADVCVTAAFLAQHNNDSRREGGVNPGRAADQPISTITAAPQQGVVAAFVSRQFGTSVGHGMDEPAHTATAEVNKSMLVAPFISKYYGVGDGSRMDEPSHTVTVKDRFGEVAAELDWPPFTEAVAARARQVADFMRAHGFWDEREFVTIDVDGDTFTIVDIGMRMLTPRELFSAQGFPADYIIDLEYNGKPLPKSDQIACCGNSVSPPVAAALVAANCGHLAEFREAAE